MSYRPKLENATPLILLAPTYRTVHGVATKTYPSEGNMIFGSFRTYGGTERNIDGLFSIEDTAVIETWYRPDIKSDCRIQIAGSDAVYDIINEPEDIDMRHQFLKFKVKRVKGGA